MKKNNILVGLVLCSSIVTGATLVLSGNTISAFATECDHVGNHYTQRDAGGDTSGCLEYWVCCKCHEHFVDAAPTGTFTDAGVATEVVESTDTRYIKPHLVYNLGFDGGTPLNDISGSGKGYAASTSQGFVTYENGPSVYINNTQTTLKAVNIPNGSGPSAYIKLPWEIANNEATTVSFWQYSPADDLTEYRWYMDVFSCGAWRYAWQFNNPGYWKGVRPCFIANGGWSEAPAAAAASANLGTHAPESGVLNFTMGGWMHTAYTYTSTGVTVYQNGKEVVTYSGNYSMKRLYDTFGDASSGIYLGGSLWGDSNLGGKLADVRVYDKALSATEIKEIPGLNDYRNFETSNYEFNSDVSDSIKKNGSGSAVSGSLVGNAYVSGGSLVLPANDGTYDTVGVALSPTVMSGSRQLTVLTKFKLESVAYWRHAFEISMNGSTFITLYVHDNSFVLKSAYKNDTWDSKIATTFAPQLNTWYTVAVICEGSTYSLIINGTLIGTMNMPFNNSVYHDCLSNASGLKIAVGYSNHYDFKNTFNGEIDYFKTYAYALTAQQAAAL